MPEDIIMPPERYEAELNRKYEVGRSVGYKEAAEYFEEKAVRFFREGDDEKARLLRDYANALREKSKKIHPGTPGKEKKDE